MTKRAWKAPTAEAVNKRLRNNAMAMHRGSVREAMEQARMWAGYLATGTGRSGAALDQKALARCDRNLRYCVEEARDSMWSYREARYRWPR